MPRLCTVCQHPERAAIEAAVVAGTPARQRSVRRCVDCGAAKPQEAFSPQMWRRWCRQPACLDCVAARLALLAQWHATQRAEQAARLRLAALTREAWAAERARFRAQRPAWVHRRRQARQAIERLRPAVLARDGWLCGLCGEFVLPADLSIDHIIPVAQGGADTLANLQVAHRRCNSRKGARRAA